MPEPFIVQIPALVGALNPIQFYSCFISYSSTDQSIRLHDKLLLVLSEAAVSSQWVEQEVETALARERDQEGTTVLFTIRIDDSVMDVKAGWPALLKNTRNVGDFTHWKEHDSYRKAFDRLLRDLRAGA